MAALICMRTAFFASILSFVLHVRFGSDYIVGTCKMNLIELLESIISIIKM